MRKKKQELKKICNHFLDKWIDSVKNTQFKVEDVFGDTLNKDSISEKNSCNKYFSSQNDLNSIYSTRINYFTHR